MRQRDGFYVTEAGSHVSVTTDERGRVVVNAGAHFTKEEALEFSGAIWQEAGGLPSLAHLDDHRRAILVLGLTGFMLQLAFGGYGMPAASAQQLHRDIPIVLELFNLLGGDENQLDPELVEAVKKALEVEAVAEHQAETS